MKSASVLNIDSLMNHQSNTPNRHEIILLKHRKSFSNYHHTSISKEKINISQLFLGKKNTIEQLRESNKNKFMNSFMDKRKKQRKRQQKRKSQSQLEKNLMQSLDKTNFMGFQLPVLEKKDGRSKSRNSKTLQLLSKFSSTIINMKSSQIKSMQTEKNQTNKVLILGSFKSDKHNNIQFNQKKQQTFHFINRRKTKSFKQIQFENYVDQRKTYSSILNSNQVLVSESKGTSKKQKLGKKQIEQSPRIRKKSIKIKGVEPWQNIKNSEENANNEMQNIQFFDFS